jgi:predicted enzyme related to lactoylglutathione lyase
MPTPAETAAQVAAPVHRLTILAVEDVARSAAFYREAFDWTARIEVPVYVEFGLADGRGFGLYQRAAYALNTGREPAMPPRGDISGAEMYMDCRDLESWAARVEAAGGRLLSPIARRDWGDTVAYFADPDGYVLALSERR